MKLLASKARSGKECPAGSGREVDEFAGATAADTSRPFGGSTEHREATTPERPWKQDDARPKGRPEKDVMGGRTKAANYEARAQAGAMLRLSRVMRNR